MIHIMIFVTTNPEIATHCHFFCLLIQIHRFYFITAVLIRINWNHKIGDYFQIWRAFHCLLNVFFPILAIAAFVKPDAGLSTSTASVEPQLIRNSFSNIVPAISIPPYNIWVLPFISKVILISYIVSILYSFINSYVLYEYTIYISPYKHYVNILLVYL